MLTISEKIRAHAGAADAGWGAAYGLFARVIEAKNLRIGAELGVAFGGHAESLLKVASVEKLYGVDPYLHIAAYEDPMNLPQDEFDQVYEFVMERLAPFGGRYAHQRKKSCEAVDDLPELDFIYVDADHSYEGVWRDLCGWYGKVRVGGIIGGHDYGHANFPGVKQAVDQFFRRFGLSIHQENEGVWWIEKAPVKISFIMPAYNCRETIEESVGSIIDGNLSEGDELIIVDDGSTDETPRTLERLKAEHPVIKILSHETNRGGGGARNTAAAAARNQLIFCLDADNILEPGAATRLKVFLETSGADVASLQELHYFKTTKDEVTHKWTFSPGLVTLADHLSRFQVPGASGNYLFTKDSWRRAGGYPEFAGALDAWGFGFRQLATGAKMMVMPESHYHHRFGHESYWVREAKPGRTSLTALQILIPFLDLLNEKDVEYIFSRRGRYSWFDDLEKRPIRLSEGARAPKTVTRLKRKTKAALRAISTGSRKKGDG